MKRREPQEKHTLEGLDKAMAKVVRPARDPAAPKQERLHCHDELLATAKHLLDLVADFANGDIPPADIKSRWSDAAKAIAKAEEK